MIIEKVILDGYVQCQNIKKQNEPYREKIRVKGSLVMGLTVFDICTTVTTICHTVPCCLFHSMNVIILDILFCVLIHLLMTILIAKMKVCNNALNF